MNKDGKIDAILYAVDTVNQHNEGYEKKLNKSLIAIVLKNKFENYYIHSFSKKIIEHSNNSPLTKVLINPNGFRLNIYYSGYYNDEDNPRQYFMDYRYDSKKHDFVISHITEFFPPTNYSGSWEKKEYSYKKNQISFKNSYHSDWR